MNKRILIVGIAVVVAIAIAASAMILTTKPEPKTRSIDFGVSTSIGGTFSPSLLALSDSLKTWDKHGIEVKLIGFRGGEAEVLTAVEAGKIKIGSMGVASVALARSKGVPVKMVSAEVIDLAWAIIVPKGSVAKTLDDLRGKEIAITTVGSGTWQNLRLLGAVKGWKEGVDFKPVAVGSPQAQLAALEQGKLPATIDPIPFAAKFLADGKGTILATTLDILPKPWLDYGLFATESLIKDDPELVRRVIRGYSDGIKYAFENKEETIKFLMDYYKVDRKLAETNYEITLKSFPRDVKITNQALQNVSDLYAKAQVVEKLPPVQEWYVQGFQ